MEIRGEFGDDKRTMEVDYVRNTVRCCESERMRDEWDGMGWIRWIHTVGREMDVESWE